MSTEAPGTDLGDEPWGLSVEDERRREAFDALLREVARAPGEEHAGALHPLAPGTLLAGRFEVVREIGRGGFARVLEARDQILSRPVAIKLLRRRRHLSHSQLELFRREAQATARLNHPHIVTAHDWGVWEGTPYLVLEFLEGETLRARLGRGPLGQERAWDIAGQIAEALVYAHAMRVLHLDLKSQNVFVLGDGRIKVLDFGLAGLAGLEGGATSLTRLAGTPATMAPEQAEGATVDARTDVWAMGVILHEMLFGRLPATLLPGKDRVELPAETPRRAAEIFSRTLRRAPADRYADASVLRSALVQARSEFHLPAGTGGDLGAGDASAVPRRSLARRGLAWMGVAVGALAVAGAVLDVHRSRHDERMRAEVLPELRRLVNSNQLMSAQRVAMKADTEFPGNEALHAFWGSFSRRQTIMTDPPGARVFWKAYDAPASAWELLGRTPLRIQYPFGVYRLRFELEGYRPYEAAPNLGFADPFPLDRVGTLPDHVIHVPRGRFGPGREREPTELGYLLEPTELGSFLIDRFEVTNRRYRAFVEAGGYRRPELWHEPFVVNGRRLSWKEAMARFVDRTGHPGPRTWEGGLPPPGKEDEPVGGVSWYEAMAYAAFEGRDLPTFFHWKRAAWGPVAGASVVEASNFSNEGVAPVGRYPGISEFGASDMAGNVREWVLNAGVGRPEDRYVLGGGWNDPQYAFTSPGLVSAWDRSVTDGFRLVTYLERNPDLEPARKPVPSPAAGFRNYARETPVGEAEFQIFQRFYAYDPKPLNATVLKTESDEDWIRQKVSFAATYGGEQVVAYLFLPRHGRPPYQTVVFFPGLGGLPGFDSFNNWGRPYWDFIVRSGRALVYPIYRGTFERASEIRTTDPDETATYRDAVIQWNQDLRRTVDYLQTRPDIDRTKLGYFGLSWGAELGPIMTALEPRFRAAVFQVGGLLPVRRLPEADPFNFLPHVKLPVLMLNGEFDEFYPYEMGQVPMLRLLGTPPESKRHVVYPAGHMAPFPRDQVMKDVLGWFDRYLGPVGSPVAPEE